MSKKIIFIDNFDSFSYNLVDELSVLGYEVLVYRNDVEIGLLEDLAHKLSAQGDEVLFVLSPGPSTPEDAHNLLPLIRTLLGHYPMLGICLGHQALGQVLGGKVVRAREIVHGKSSLIEHDGTLCFKGLPNPLKIARYHSLIVTDLPPNVSITSSYEGMCMSFYEAQQRVIGFQFHPESVLTTYGRPLLANALQLLLSRA
ncbi:MAG: aminodeoxychorismate/anthranilate synthase component II [Succinivibrio sp.]|nr:aminodeoxychorismate/anthranilate synthase component II [Succinivibrio sp.]